MVPAIALGLALIRTDISGRIDFTGHACLVRCFASFINGAMLSHDSRKRYIQDAVC
jgi:hypothetical protein